MSDDVVEGGGGWKWLSLGSRKALYFMIESKRQDGILPRGSITSSAKKIRVAPRRASRVYKEMKANVDAYLVENQENMNTNTFLLPDYLFQDNRDKLGRPLKWDRDKLNADIKKVPYKDRNNLHVLAESLGVPISTVHRMKMKGDFRRHRSCLKPKLTEENVERRLEWCWGKVDETGFLRETRRLVYDLLYHEIHVDEKWFYLIKEGAKYYLAHDEDPPVFSVQNKNTVPKVMFLCGLARPRYVGRQYFDGKIGIWPIGYMKPAERSSVNRPKGTPEWVSVKVDRIQYRNILMYQLLPAIIEKWPTCLYTGRPLLIQQDGAPAHLKVVDDVCIDEIWVRELTKYGLQNRILLVTQPPNSPDLNVNDLGFFNSLQAQYWRTNPNNAMELIAMVEKTFKEYNPKKINRIFLSLMMNMNCILENNGSNKYKTPHMGKDKLEREGRLPSTINVYIP